MNSITEFFSPRRSDTAQMILRQNERIAVRGLSLTPADAQDIAETHAVSLRENRLVEIGAGSVEKIITEFSASPYVTRENFATVVEMMTEAFCYLKREAQREVSDKTVIAAMRAMFDEGSQGTEELFLGRDMERLLQCVRHPKTLQKLMRCILEESTLEFMESPTVGDREEFLREYFPASADREPEVWEEENDGRESYNIFD